jgi:hypothetical protein
MKSPAELTQRWLRQWEASDHREQRLLEPDTWPIELPIGRPTAQQFERQTREVREHVIRWRAVTVGQVIYESVRFRSGGEPVELPVRWVLRSPKEWMKACGDPLVEQEHERLSRIVAAVDPTFRRTLVRRRHLLGEYPESEIPKVAEVALALAPGSAEGRPLRGLSVCGVDSKFFERQRSLLLQLLDIRFGGEASSLGLETFLGAPDENDHWLLVAPLAQGLMPFAQQRARASELQSTPLPGTHLLIVENESCLHQLPVLADTVTILGSGLNLEWMQGTWLSKRFIGYWGDLDTWGLAMLAKARRLQPGLTPLLMTRHIFDAHAIMAVVEPRTAAGEPPEGLTEPERTLYRDLFASEHGRLEQEFLPPSCVKDALSAWRLRSGP